MTSSANTFTVNSFYDWIKKNYTVHDIERKQLYHYEKFHQGQLSFAEYLTEYNRRRNFVKPRPSDNSLKQQIYLGLRPQLKDELDKQPEIKDFQEWCDALHRYATVLDRGKARQEYQAQKKEKATQLAAMTSQQLKGSGGKKKGNFQKRGAGSNDPRGCFNCKQPGHYARDCPRLPKRDLNTVQTDSFKGSKDGGHPKVQG